MQSASEIITALGGLTKVARYLGIPRATTVQFWKETNRIPPQHWSALIDKAAVDGVKGVTADLLVRIHAAKPAATVEAAE